MSETEENSIYDAVVGELLSYGEHRAVDEGQCGQIKWVFKESGCDINLVKDIATFTSEEQERVQGIVKSISLQARLPDVCVLFDEKGVMSLDLSDEDMKTYIMLFKERWPMIEDAFLTRDVVCEDIASPECPDFLDRNSEFVFAESGGEEDILSLLNENQKREYNDYTKQLKFWFEAGTTANVILNPLRQKWDKDNSQHDFMSITDKKVRFYYDACRDKKITFDDKGTLDI